MRKPDFSRYPPAMANPRDARYNPKAQNRPLQTPVHNGKFTAPEPRPEDEPGVPKVVVFTPAGRRPYMELLTKHLSRQQDDFDEYHIWVNPRSDEDRKYLTEELPASGLFREGKLKLVERKFQPRSCNWHNLCNFWDDACDKDTIYVRLDDDIIWMEHKFVSKLVKARRMDMNPWFVSANVINNPVTSHFHQKVGAIDHDMGWLTGNHDDGLGYYSGEFARKVHRNFLKNIGNLEKFNFGSAYLNPGRRVPINAIAFYGKDTKASLYPFTASDEELYFTTQMTERLRRGTLVYGSPVCVHFSYNPVEAELLRSGILDAYRNIAEAL